MGCQNSHGQNKHWFGNIHFSGPCNRSCYFCVGQFMMEQDRYNNLKEFPIKGLDNFISELNNRAITEVNLTGTNTDPSLYCNIIGLKEYLLRKMPLKIFGIRTNGVTSCDWGLFDQISISCHGISKAVYRKMMGSGELPDIKLIVSQAMCPVRINFVLSTFNIHDLPNSLRYFKEVGIESVNIREPYGQPIVGNPFYNLEPEGMIHEMPYYSIDGLKVVYWDVNFCAVDSVNLYADGHTSISYLITKGCISGDEGKVLAPSLNGEHKRIYDQWLSK